MNPGSGGQAGAKILQHLEAGVSAAEARQGVNPRADGPADGTGSQCGRRLFFGGKGRRDSLRRVPPHRTINSMNALERTQQHV